MERLTKYDTDGQAMMDCEKCKADWTGKHGKPMVDCTALYCRNRLKEHLAAYEDTGLTPETIIKAKGALEYAYGNADRIIELAKADKDGRVVVLPCKVEQRVFALLHGERRVTECEVKQVVSGDLDWVTLEPCGKSGTEYGVALNGFGKTVFLTREDAESALEAMKDG